MSDIELIDAVAQKTGEDSHEIRRRGFTLTGPDDRLEDSPRPQQATGVECGGGAQASPTHARRFFTQRFRAKTNTPAPTMRMPNHSRTEGRS